jgi:hypothetical protein
LSMLELLLVLVAVGGCSALGACLSLFCLVFLVLLLLAFLVDGVPRGGRVLLTTSMAEWKMEGDDASGGGPDPIVSLLTLRRE